MSPLVRMPRSQDLGHFVPPPGEAEDGRFYNAAAHYSARVYHDHGANVDFIITVRELTLPDDFASTTQSLQAGCNWQ